MKQQQQQQSLQQQDDTWDDWKPVVVSSSVKLLQLLSLHLLSGNFKDIEIMKFCSWTLLWCKTFVQGFCVNLNELMLFYFCLASLEFLFVCLLHFLMVFSIRNMFCPVFLQCCLFPVLFLFDAQLCMKRIIRKQFWY